MDSFWDVLSKLFSIVKKILILTYLWRISTFSLLSYIEIYIDYSETALGGVRDPKKWSKNSEKNHSVFHTKMMSESRLEHDFLKKASF